jgi:hypothetical protein
MLLSTDLLRGTDEKVNALFAAWEKLWKGERISKVSPIDVIRDFVRILTKSLYRLWSQQALKEC